MEWDPEPGPHYPPPGPRWADLAGTVVIVCTPLVITGLALWQALTGG